MKMFRNILLAAMSIGLSISAQAQAPVIQTSEITGQGGTYAVGQEVTFTFTLTNAAENEEVPAVPDPDTPAAQQEREDVRARNNARIARGIFFTGNLVGQDIYGNDVEVPVSQTSSTSELEPGDSFDFTGRVTIPEDGTFHSMRDPGYQIVGELSYSFIEPVDGQTDGPVRELSSVSDIFVDVPANLTVENITYPSGTFRGGDIIQVSVTVQNRTPDGSTTIVRPLTSNEDFRTNLYLSDNASIDSGSDFLLGFFTLDGDSVSTVSGTSQVRVVRTGDTPPALSDWGRDYVPQSDDGFLDIDEAVVVTYEVLVPRNFPGTYFVGAFTDALDKIVELEEAVDASFNDQGDNIFVQSFTPQIRIVSSSDPTTEPVSERTALDGNQLESSDGLSDQPSVSENGKWITFHSTASNLDPSSPGNGRFQVYLRNRETREISLISRSNAGRVGDRDSRNPVISADGRFVAYESLASNLVAGTQGAGSQVYVYDRQLQRTTRVSVNSVGLPANGSSFAPAISENGRIVIFESVANNLLDPNDPDFDPSVLGNNPPVQVYVHNRDVSNSRIFDQGGNRSTFLVSSLAGAFANRDALSPAISLDGRTAVFASRSTNFPKNPSPISQIWKRDLDTSGRPLRTVELVSVNKQGDRGSRDSSEPVVNGGPTTPTYGLQVAFSSEADNLVSGDTNQVSDVFVRNYANPADVETVRVSVSNPRVAFGRITFAGVIGGDNIPDNQPDPGDTVTLNDGTETNPPVTFTFQADPIVDTDVAIGATTGETRDNLVAAINSSGSLNIVAYSADPPTGLDSAPPFSFFTFALGLDGHSPALILFNTIPGEQGNQPILKESGVLSISSMSQGGTQANDALGSDLTNPFNIAEGSLQPTLDRSGRIVAFRSLATNLSVVRDGDRFFKNEVQPDRVTPRVGEVIRPLITFASNVYFRDRDVDGTGDLDIPENSDTALASVNRFGYPTNQLLNTADSASSRMPALSANGRFIAFASDSVNTGGLRFGDTNRQPLDNNNVRDVFIYDRNTPSDIGGGSIAPAFTTPMAPAVRTARNGQSIVFQSETTGVEPVRFQWRKDGVNLNDSARISGTATRELFISDLQPGDAGIYVVVAQNVFGVATSPTFELVIGSGSDGGADNLIIDRQPEAKQRPVGGVATFEVAASASGSISYQWMKDGVDLSDGARISGASTAQLQLFNLESADAGNYSVRVLSNGQGPLFSSPAALAVTAAPVITVQPQSLSLASGGTGQLEVAATSSRPLSYQWFKGGTPIPGASANALVIAQAAAIDAGSYSVRVSDDLGGQIMSAVVSVQVGGASGTSLPVPLQAASSLGSDWYKLPWFGSFAAPGGPGSNWIYRNDLGWLFVAPAGSTNGFWFWSHALSSWMWTSQSAAGNGFYYKWSDADWMFIQPQSSGFGAWIKSTQTGDWTSLNP